MAPGSNKLNVLRQKTDCTGSSRKRKLSVNLDDVHQDWTLQPEMESLPWDSNEEFTFPIQVPHSLWTLIESPSFIKNQSSKSHKKQKLDLSKRQLLIENIPPEVTMSDLQDHLSSFGQIYSLDVLQTTSTDITQQLNFVTATVFLEKYCNVFYLDSFDWKEFGEGVSAYFIRRPTQAWLRLTNLPHRTKMKTLMKRLSNHVPVTEVVKHSQVCRSAILTFEEILPVNDVLELQQVHEKLLGNRLIFTANNHNVKKISTSPVQVDTLFLPKKYSSLGWHEDTGTFYHDAKNLSNKKTKIGGSESMSGNQIQEGDKENVEGRAVQWEHGEDLASATVCIVGLPAHIKRKGLKKLLASAECGAVVEVVLHLDRLPAHAYVTFETKEGVDKALTAQCQLGEDAPRLIYFAASKTLSPAYLTELLFQADKKNNNGLFCDADIFQFSLSNHNSPAHKNIDPFELPPNTVLVVGGLGDLRKKRVMNAFSNQFGKVIWVELLKTAWPVHGYISFAEPKSSVEAVKQQLQVNDYRMTLTVATGRKYTLEQIVELSKEYPDLYLDGVATSTPLFYRTEKEAPAWAAY